MDLMLCAGIWEHSDREEGKKNNCNHSCVNSRIKTEKYESTNIILTIKIARSYTKNEEIQKIKPKNVIFIQIMCFTPYALPFTIDVFLFSFR